MNVEGLTGTLIAPSVSAKGGQAPVKQAPQKASDHADADFRRVNHNPEATAQKMRGIIDQATSKGLLSPDDYATARRAQGAYMQAQAQLVWDRVDTIQSAFSGNPINEKLSSSSRIAAQAPYEEAATKYRASHQLVKQGVDIRKGTGYIQGIF